MKTVCPLGTGVRIPLPPPKIKTPIGVFFVFRGIRTRRERSGRKQSGGLFLPTWVTSAARRKSAAALGRIPLPPPKIKTPIGVFFVFRGIRTRRERSGRKQSGGLFLPTWVTSAARRKSAAALGRIPLPPPKIKTPVGVFFVFGYRCAQRNSLFS